MARATLPTNSKDDILASSMGGKRRYVLTENSDGTYSLEDATTYTQVGSAFGAAQVNATNKAVNESVDKAVIIENLDDVVANTTNGKVAGALALKELNSKFIIEMGSNTHGNYRKYSDGTLEMWGNKNADYLAKTAAGSMYVSTGIPIVFPVASITNCAVILQKVQEDIEASFAGCAGKTAKTGTTAYIVSAFAINEIRQAYIHWHAFGKWK